MKKIYLLALIASAFLMQIVNAQDIVKTSEVRDNGKRGYLIGPGDKIEGKVLGEDQFGFTAVIDENGNFSVPFDEEQINANCRTEQDVRGDVTKRVAKYVRSPMVSVNVTERRKPVPVTVYGEVRTPSQIELRREATLMELIAAANGVSEDAGGIVRIYRPHVPRCSEGNLDANWQTDANEAVEVPSRMYSLSSIQTGGRESNPIIYPGDVISVEKASPVYVNGEVRSPQGIHIKEGGLSLAQALAMVGGVTETANVKKILVYRRKSNSQDRESIAVNFDETRKNELEAFMLQPYDEIVVGKKKKSIGEIILNTLVQTGTGAISGIGYGLPQRVLY